MSDLAREWREKSAAAAGAEMLELPSGMVIRARRPGAMQLAVWDRLPLTIAAMFDSETAGQMTREDAEETNEFLHQVLAFVCVEPRVVRKDAGEGEILPHEIGDSDLQFLIGWSLRLREAEAFRTFRPGRTDDGTGHDGEAVFSTSIGAPGDPGRSAGAGVRPGGGAAGDRAGEEGRGGE